VNPKEQEIAIGELEERVDRLRNIYEQYFLGFEKLEPTVPRKDVDRRFAILRKEQIRNTAMRFRFQVVTQKFNTYAMHWVRICRQIEDGTYKRHIRKAKARFGDGPRSGAEADVSIDIDMDDFDVDDVEGALAEADASVASYEMDGGDTIPPPPAPHSVRGLGDRTARGAALPEGSKPRILRKRDDTEPPPSARGMPAASSPRLPAPSSPGFDPPPASNPRLQASRPDLDIPGGRPVGPRIQRAAPPESSARLPAGTPSAGAHAAGRIPVAAPVGAPSAGRLPVPAPPPAGPGPAPSAGRFPASPAMRPPPGVPGGGGGGGGGAKSAGGMKAAPPPPASVPRLPPTTLPRPPPRAPAPSVPDTKDTIPPSAESRPSVRPRAPLPLPSQLGRPTTKGGGGREGE
jgi:hypothetical protein